MPFSKLHAAAHQIESADFDRKHPERYSLETWLTPTEAHADILRQIRTGLTGFRPWWLVCGGPGAGKTRAVHGMAMAKIIQHADANDGWNPVDAPVPGREWDWTPFRQYGRNGQDPYRPLRAVGTTLFGLMQEIAAAPRDWPAVRKKYMAPILLLDEVREIRMGTVAAASLDELLNLRYKHKLFTVFVSNLLQADVWTVLGERVESRFRELGNGNYVGMKGIGDWRAKLIPDDPVAPAAGQPIVRRDANAR